MKRRFFALLAAALMTMSALTGVAQASDNANEVAREARKGVVRILTFTQKDYYIATTSEYFTSTTSAAVGTGFGVGTAGEETNVFVTNRHVVSGEDTMETVNGINFYVRCTTTGVYILLDSYAYNGTLDYSRSVPCTVLYIGENADADVAVIKAAEPVSGRMALPLLGDEDSLKEVDWVCSLGYPASSDTTSGSYLLADINDVTVQTGTVARLSDNVSVNTSTTAQGRVIQHSATINGGNSGGPLIDANGAVVGINTFVYHGGSDTVSNAYYAIRIKYAKDALDSLEISYDLYKEKSGLPVLPIVIVAVVVIAAAAAFVLLKTKKVALAPAGASRAKAPGKAAGGQPQTAQRALVRSLSPQHNGLTLVVRDGSILIGRDPSSCKVVYPEGTAGVSGQHCSVAYDSAKGEFIVTDLRSTYGTFLMNGQKLDANVPYRIKPGSGFYVGDRANAIRVELG